MHEFKKISSEFIDEALAKADKYRMLNHPKTSESICRDVLDIDPGNQNAITLLIIAITGQFSNSQKYPGTRLKDAQVWIKELADEYKKEYFAGLVLERWAKSKVRDLPGADLYEFFEEAMVHYDRAEKLAPHGDESAKLHYNFCIRFMDRHTHIRPPVETADGHLAHNYGDGISHH